MFYHAKELQFNARVSEADPKFAALLLEQLGGANGELAAAMRYFTQSFASRSRADDLEVAELLGRNVHQHVVLVRTTSRPAAP